MVLAIAQGRSQIVKNAGELTSASATIFPFYINSIYIGSYSDHNPQSFSGFMKEVKIISKFHAFA